MFKKFLKNKKVKIALIIGKYLAFAFVGLCLLVLGVFFYYTWDLPRPEKFEEAPFVQSTKIYDRTGQTLLYDVYGEEKRQVVPFNQISDNLKHAVLSIEDANFYNHGALDFKSVARAVLIDLKFMSANQGASTITQQLIRSVYLTNQKSVARKVREAILSIELERRYSKDQIFNWYLNQIPFGQNAYGAEAASQTYFSKSSSQLTVPEAAVLAAIIQAPSRYSPYGPNKNLLLQRKDYVLDRMKTLGYINQKEADEAKKQTINFSDSRTSIKAPEFVMYVQKYLEDKYGDDFLQTKGLKVYTTLDWSFQDYAEQAIKSADKVNTQFDANNAALVVIGAKTGEILALVGSKDYFGKSYPEGCDLKGPGKCLFDPKFDVATMGLRQPGSAFKPFVYATAFKKGYTPNTLLWDVPTEFNPNCAPGGWQERDQYGNACYHPHDYDGLYRGRISMRYALDMSLNIPAVQTLYLAGLPDSLQTAHDMGITTLNDTNRYGLALVLGGGEVTLLDITSAYGVFANEGTRVQPVSILKIEDSDGNIVEQNQMQGRKVLDTQVAREINNVLSDNNARAPMFGANNALYFDGYDVAAKTGTTQYFQDAWTVGYSPSFSVGVWVGNNDNSSTNKKTGIGLAAPIWRQIMLKLLQSNPIEHFTPPDPVQITNPYLAGQFPIQDPPHSALFYVDKSNPTGPAPTNPASDPLYYNWESAVSSFYGGANIAAQ